MSNVIYPSVVTINDLVQATTLSTTALFEVTQTASNGQLESVKVSIAQIASAVVTAGGAGSLPTGGGTGQVLSKFAGNDGSATWTDIATSIVGSTGISISGSTIAVVGFSTATPLSVLGVAGAATAVPLPIAGTGAQVMRVDDGGTGVGFGSINLASTAAVTGTLALAYGGIGFNVAATGDLVYAANATTLARLAAATMGFVLTANGTLAQPSYQTPGAVVGGLPVGGATGTILAKVDASNYNASWIQISDALIASTGISIGAGTAATIALATTTPLSVLGVAGAATANPLPIAGTGAQVLRINDAGTIVGFGTVNLGSSAAVSGVLPLAQGGWSTSTLTAFGVVVGNAAAKPLITAAGTTDWVLTGNGTLVAPSFKQVNLTMSVTGTLTVPFGGIGTAALTAYAVVCGGTTSVGPFQAIATTAATGTVLTSNGPGFLPSFQALAGSGDVVGPASAGDLALAAFNGVTGKLLINTPTAINTTSGIITISTGALTPNIPQTSQAAAYTAILADANTQLLHPLSDGTNRIFTIPSNASVAYPIGTCLTFINQTATITIAIISDTLMFAGVGATGSRTLAANGMASAIKVNGTTWFISGSGLT